MFQLLGGPRYAAIIPIALQFCGGVLRFPRMAPFAIAAIVLILARWAAEFCLGWLNQQHVRANAAAIPGALRGVVDEETYRRSIDYTLAKWRFGNISDAFDTTVLLVVLCTGLLPWALAEFV